MRSMLSLLRQIAGGLDALSPGDELRFGNGYTITPLGQGTYNTNYKLLSGNSAYVVRFSIEQQSGDSRQLEKEHAILKFLQHRIAVPRPYHFERASERGGEDFMVTDFIRGLAPRPGVETARQCAMYLACLHSIDVSTLSKNTRSCSYSPRSAIEMCQRLLAELSSRLASGHSLAPRYRALLRLAERRKSLLNDQEVNLIHGDPVPSNFVQKDNGRVVMIDWETHCLCHWVHDVWAMLSNAHNTWDWKRAFDEEEHGEFVQAYSRKRLLQESFVEKCVGAVELVFSLRYSMWCFKKHLDYVEGRISERLLRNGGHKNFEKMLRASRAALAAAEAAAR